MNRPIVIVGVLGAALIAAAGSFAGPARAGPLEAQAKLKTAAGQTIGTVTFRDDPRSDVVIVRVNLKVPPVVTGPPTFRGLHVHANDNPANGTGCVADPAAPSTTWFVSADGHYRRATTEVHGNHAGDLPSIYVGASGIAEMRTTKDTLNPSELVGRAVVLHAGPDNFGNVPVGAGPEQYTPGVDAVAKTQATGNAGDRFACGVVALT